MTLDCEPEGGQFNSQSGHRPGLRARSPVWGARGSRSTCSWGGGLCCTVSVAGSSQRSPRATQRPGGHWGHRACLVLGRSYRKGPAPQCNRSRKPGTASPFLGNQPQQKAGPHPQSTDLRIRRTPHPLTLGGPVGPDKELGRRPYWRGVRVWADLGGRRRGPHPEAHPIKEKQRAEFGRLPSPLISLSGVGQGPRAQSSPGPAVGGPTC